MLVVEPTGGLANKLRVVFSYLKVAERDNKQLTVIWEKNNACKGYFLDYFQPVERITFLTKNTDSLSVDYCGCSCHGDFNTYNNFIYSDLKLKENIYDSINQKLKLLGNFIAIQVRRTDHIELAKSHNRFTTDEDFCTFIESNPDGNLFIASDNRDSYEYFKSKYPDRVKLDYPDSDSTSLRHTSLEDSIIDLFICARALHVKTSGYSSFGDLILQLHNNFILSTT